MPEKLNRQAVTFDDVLLEPRFSDVLPSQVDVEHPVDAAIRLTSL